ncbi:MAG TPA: DUF6157 family protein [Longimicrobiales bacterium]
MDSTNYYDTFIAVAHDSTTTRGTVPPDRAKPSVALCTWHMIHDHPYRYTSDDVIFTVHADRHGVSPEDRPRARVEYFSRPRPCLRTSDLPKKYGWGIHCDSQGRVALYGMETPEYAEFVSGRRRSGARQVIVIRAARARRQRS